MSTDLIAFYGTLEREDADTPVHPVIEKELEYRGPCVIPGKIYDMGRYPALKLGYGEVKGELFRIVDPDALPKLDLYEKYDNDDKTLPGFERRLVKLIDPKKEAWVYVYEANPNKNHLINSGRWRITGWS